MQNKVSHTRDRRLYHRELGIIVAGRKALPPQPFIDCANVEMYSRWSRQLLSNHDEPHPSCFSGKLASLKTSRGRNACHRSTSETTKTPFLCVCDFPQSSNGRSNGSSRRSSEGVCSSGVDFSTWLALPDTDGSSLDSVLFISSRPVFLLFRHN